MGVALETWVIPSGYDLMKKVSHYRGRSRIMGQRRACPGGGGAPPCPGVHAREGEVLVALQILHTIHVPVDR